MPTNAMAKPAQDIPSMFEVIGEVDTALADLSIDAAIEFDKLASGEAIELTAVSQLAEALKSTGFSGANKKQSRLQGDPEILSVLNSTASSLRGAFSDVNELTSWLNAISDDIASATTEVDPQKLAQMRDFCVALNEAVISQRPTYDHRETQLAFT